MQLTQTHLLSFVSAYKAHIASVHQDGGVRPTDMQSDAPWALDRIDQDTLPLNHEYIYSDTGSNVNVYVIDTVSHPMSAVYACLMLCPRCIHHTQLHSDSSSMHF